MICRQIYEKKVKKEALFNYFVYFCTYIILIILSYGKAYYSLDPESRTL